MRNRLILRSTIRLFCFVCFRRNVGEKTLKVLLFKIILLQMFLADYIAGEGVSCQVFL